MLQFRIKSIMLQPLRQKIRIQKNNYWVSDKNVIKNDKISLLLNDISLNLKEDTTVEAINTAFKDRIYRIVADLLWRTTKATRSIASRYSWSVV